MLRLHIDSGDYGGLAFSRLGARSFHPRKFEWYLAPWGYAFATEVSNVGVDGSRYARFSV